MPPVKKSKKTVDSTPLKYPTPTVELHVGDNSLTVEKAKELLGWSEETDDVKFDSDYMLIDHVGKKIRTANNNRNRAISMETVRTYAQDILNKRWRLNGESMVIGNRGEIISGQHRLCALIIADQLRLDAALADHWAEKWTGPVTLDCIITYGVDEGDDTVNTIDTGRPRSLTDCLYRSEHFAKIKPAERKVAASMCDHAIRMLWHRTGHDIDAFAPKRTHQEAMDFLNHHKSLLQCVQHIRLENVEGHVSKIIPPGYASALLYLMASSGSDGDKYREAEPRRESVKAFDWGRWDEAEKYWLDLLSGQEKEVVTAIKDLSDPDTGRVGSLAEKMAILIKGWNTRVAGDKITPSKVKLQYHTDKEGWKTLIECPDVGGIDMGDPKEAAPVGGETPTERDPSPAELKQRAEAEKKASIEAKKMDEGKPGPKPVPQKTGIRAEIAAMYEQAGGARVGWESEGGGVIFFQEDAQLLSRRLKLKMEKGPEGVDCVNLPADRAEQLMSTLVSAGIEVKLVKGKGDAKTLVAFTKRLPTPTTKPGLRGGV